jgi:2,3-bisphosphoglycerate-independent phosphoglycerate mutase
LIANARAQGSTLHLIGLLSDGNVHSHLDHAFAVIDHAVSEGVARIRVHALFDGRDVPDNSATSYVQQVHAHIAALGAVDIRFASGGGRMTTTMDRYGADWRIVEAGWRAHVLGDAHAVRSVEEGIGWGRDRLGDARSDQLLPAFTVVDADGLPEGAIVDGDSVLLFNFRGDRAMELAAAFDASADHFTHFDRVRVPKVYFAGMALYDGDTNVPRKYLVNPETVDNTLSELVARSGLRQWAGAETQKFGHITYFWNGNRSSKFDEALETYVEIPSDQVEFNERPWMKSAETADAAIEAINSGEYDFVRLNLAGGDMVGHTADMAATRIAVESVDLAIGRIERLVRAFSGVLVVTADHGNADDKVERDGAGNPLFHGDGSPIGRTAHSLNPVPFLVQSYDGVERHLRADLPDAGLANIAATVLDLLGIGVPSDYEPSLFTPTS